MLEVLIPIGFVIYVAIFALLRLGPRIPAGAAVALLATAAITLVVGSKGLANQLAIYACYFLASGVVLVLI